MTSILQVLVHIEKEHEPFLHNGPFHIHHNLGRFRLFQLPEPVAAFQEEEETFPDGCLYTAVALFGWFYIGL